MKICTVASSCNWLIVASSQVLWVCSALVNHHLLRANSVPRLQSFLHSDSCPQSVSPETNFWIARTQNNSTCSSDIPAIPRLDYETGPLPPGAYRKSCIHDCREMIAPCLISLGIRPPTESDAGEDVWREGARNCQKMIDAGFNSFRFNNGHRIRHKMHKRDNRNRSLLTTALVRMQHLSANTEYRHRAEAQFYQKLKQDTPSSVLRSCRFMVNLEMPLPFSGLAQIPGMENELTQSPYGNGLMLKECVSSALLRTKSERLDSVVFEFSGNSPYHIDAVHTLFELKREGLIQSISTKNFPTSLLLELSGIGFNTDSNDVIGNIMNTNNLQHDSPTVANRLISTPLGGGLFTNQFSELQEWVHLSPASKNNFNDLLQSCCATFARSENDSLLKWKTYRTIMDSLVDMSFKYQVSVESILLRWLLQLNNGDSVCVGTLMGMNLVEDQGGRPYNRHRDLREVFTFSLEENDIEELRKVSDLMSRPAEADIDFTDRRLFV